MRRTLVAAAVTALFASIGACQPRLEQVWELRNFRVLGAKAVPAEAERGSTVRLSLSYADTRDRPVQVVWFVCAQGTAVTGGTDAGVDGGGGGGASPLDGCPPAASQVGVGEQATFNIPATGGSMDAQGREILSVIGYACAGGTIGAPAGDAGSPLPACTAPVGSTDTAQGWLFTRSIYVRGPASLNAANQNPSVTEVRFDGVTFATDAPPRVPRCEDQTSSSTCTQHHFEVLFASDSRETFNDRDPVSGEIRPRAERLTVGYVIEAGELGGGFRTDTAALPESTMDNTWRAPAAPGTYRLYVYAFDGRGGFDSTRRSIVVE